MLKNQSFDFTGKTAIVTGASRGIGKAIAQGLHEAGAKVYALARNPETLEALTAECPGIHTRVCDVSVWDATRKVVEEIPEDSIDFLVNNAATFYNGSFMACKPEEFDEIYRTNVLAVMNISQIVAKKMLQNGGGSILNVSSTGGIVPVSYSSAYSVSKAALNHMTKVMAQELGPHNIRVNCVNPGFVQTDMFEEYLQGVADAFGLSNKEAARVAGNNLIKLPQKTVELTEMVNAVLFLLSSACPMIHGALVPIEGGILVNL